MLDKNAERTTGAKKRPSACSLLANVKPNA